MPEMTAMPILPSVAPPASSSSPVSGLAARADKAANSSPPINSASSSPDAGAAPNDNSFASVLKRQLEQAMPAPPAGTAVVTGANAKVLPDISVVIDAKVQSLPETAVVIDAKVQSLPETAVVIDANVQTLPDTVAIIGANAKALTGGALVAAPKESSLPSKSDDEASQEKSVGGIATQSPYLLALAANPSVRIEVNSQRLPITEKKPSAAQDGTLPTLPTLPFAAATPVLVESRLADTKDAPTTKLAEMSQTAANKTAEFAAGLSSSSEVAPSQTHQNESSSIESGFENLLVAAQAVGRNTGLHAPSHTSPSLPVQTPVGAHGWDGEVSDKLVWMVGRQEQRAELVLNPPQLGRVEVSLSMSDGQTTASFVSANPAVRDALEAALPRLREILADAGVSLGQAQVGADAGSNQTANQSTNNPESWDNSRRTANKFDLTNGVDMLRPIETTQWIRQSNSLVDVFA